MKQRESTAAQFAQQLPVVLEEYSEHPGDGEDDLAVGDIEKQTLPPPLAPLLQALGMVGGTESPSATGEHHEAFRLAGGKADAGKPAARVAAV